MKTWISLVICGLVAVMVGCGGSGKIKVSGTATLDGQPIPNGEIRFVDTTSAEFSDGGVIQDGKFSFETTPRSNRVEIRASRESATKTVDDAMSPGKVTKAMEEYIPAKYNEKSNLNAEVKAGESNTYDFKLESK